MNKDAKFWNKVAEKYSKQPISDMQSYEHKLEKTREFFTKDTIAMEIGCGTGSTALLHAPYVKHYRAIDFSSDMIKIAQNKLKKENIKNVSFETSSTEGLIVDKPVDAILALSILHLVEDLDDTIKNAHGWLKQGGVFVSSTVCLGDNMKFFKLLAPLGRAIGLMPLLKIFSKAHLRKRLEQNGFRIVYEWQPAKKRIPSVFIIAEKV